MKNFIASCALVTAVCFGVVAVTGSAFADEPIIEYYYHDTRLDYNPDIMPLAVSGSLSFVPYSSEMNLFVDQHGTLINAQTFTDLFTNVTTTNNYTSAANGAMASTAGNSYRLTLRGSITSATIRAPFVQHVTEPGEFHFTGSLRSDLNLFSEFAIRVSSSQYARYYASRSIGGPSAELFVYPKSVDVLLDGVVVAQMPAPSISGKNVTYNYDFYVPVSSGDYSSIDFRFNFDYSIDEEFYWVYISSSSSSNYTTNIIGLYVANATSGGYSYAGVGGALRSYSTSYSFEPSTTGQVVDRGFSQVHDDLTDINDTLKDIQGTIESGLSDRPMTPMEQFEADYLENFEGQISKTEQAMSPSNPGLPNGGDVGGFVSGLQDGLGVSGDSFSMSDFNNAVGSFSGSASTSEDGPWWFFSEEVVQDMSGDVSTLDLDDSWFWSFYDDFERRLKNHGIGSVGS